MRKKTKADYIRNILLSGDTISQLEAYNLKDDNGRLIPHTRLSGVIFRLREEGWNISSLTPKEANARLGYHRYDDGDYTVYVLEKGGQWK